MVALLIGGLATSLGPMFLTRTKRGRALLLRANAVGLALFALAVLAAGGGAAYWMVRAVLDTAGGAPALPSPLPLLGVGLCVGLALSLPSVFMAWIETRAAEKLKHQRRERVATKDDRRAFVEDLARQIRDVSHPPREVRTSIAGNGGTILELEGDFSAKEGERLTDALREDLKSLGFKRVEGKSAGGDWWSRV